MKFDILGLILAHAFLSLGQSFLDLKSIGPLKTLDRFKTGCIFTGTEIIYQCINTKSGGDDRDVEFPQVPTLRIDCRGARGNFRNLTLYDSRRSCGRLSYRKYGNLSEIKPPIITELPLRSDHVVTIEKEDILDIQCIPFDLPLHSLFHQPDLEEEGMRTERWWFPFELLQDGHGRVEIINPFIFGILFGKGSGVEACFKTLAEAFRGKMTVSKSEGFTHWIRFSPAVAAVPAGTTAVPAVTSKPIFPKMGCCNISGEIFQVDKDILQLTVVKARSYSIFGPEEFKKTSKPNEWFVRLDPDFYNTTIEQNRFGLDFKLEVNPDVLLPDIIDVNVRLQIFRINLRHRFRHDYIWFKVTLPVNSTGLDSEPGSRVVWMVAFFFFIFLLCGFCYVYREDFQMSSEPEQRDRNDRTLETNGSVSIELQGS